MKRICRAAVFPVLVMVLLAVFGTALATGKIEYGPKTKTVAVGDQAVFRAGATGFTGITWHFVSPDGSTDLLAKEIPDYFPGTSVYGKNSSAFTIKHVTAEMNGWQVYCVFSGNGKAATEKATLWIDSCEVAEAELQSHEDAEETDASDVTDTDAEEISGETGLTVITQEPDPSTRLIITAVNCTLSADGYESGTSIDFTEAGTIKVKVTGKNVGYWVINGTRYDFSKVPKTITISNLKHSLTIEACKKNASSTTLLSEDDIQAMRTGETLKVTTKDATMCHLTARKAQKGGWFSSFDFTEDFTNKATKKTEDGGRVTVYVKCKPGYGEDISYWIINGVHFSFNTYVTAFTVTNLRETTKYQAVFYNTELYNVKCTNCTFSDDQHYGSSSGLVPRGTVIKVTPNVSGSGLWSGSKTTTSVVAASTISYTVRSNCSFIWTSYTGKAYYPVTASLPAFPVSEAE